MTIYKADFGIDNGKIAQEVISSSYTKRLGEMIEGKDDVEALANAANLANKLSLESGDSFRKGTSVTLLRLYDSNQRTLDQKKIVQNQGIDGIKHFEWSEDKLKITSSSLEQKLYMNK